MFSCSEVNFLYRNSEELSLLHPQSTYLGVSFFLPSTLTIEMSGLVNEAIHNRLSTACRYLVLSLCNLLSGSKLKWFLFMWVYVSLEFVKLIFYVFRQFCFLDLVLDLVFFSSPLIYIPRYCVTLPKFLISHSLNFSVYI